MFVLFAFHLCTSYLETCSLMQQLNCSNHKCNLPFFLRIVDSFQCNHSMITWWSHVETWYTYLIRHLSSVFTFGWKWSSDYQTAFSTVILDTDSIRSSGTNVTLDNLRSCTLDVLPVSQIKTCQVVYFKCLNRYVTHKTKQCDSFCYCEREIYNIQTRTERWDSVISVPELSFHVDRIYTIQRLCHRYEVWGSAYA